MIFNPQLSGKAVLLSLILCGSSFTLSASNTKIEDIAREFSTIEKCLTSGDLYSAKCAWVRLKNSGFVNKDYRFYDARARLERALAESQDQEIQKIKKEYAELEFVFAVEALKRLPRLHGERSTIIKRLKAINSEWQNIADKRLQSFDRACERVTTLKLLRYESQAKDIDYLTTMDNIEAHANALTEKCLAQKAEHYATALKFINKAIELSDHTSTLYKERAELYQISGNIDKVIENYEMYVKRSPYSSEGFYRKACAYYAKANVSENIKAEDYLQVSIRDLSKALELLDTYLMTTRDKAQIIKAKSERRMYEDLAREQVALRARLDDEILNDNKKQAIEADTIDQDLLKQSSPEETPPPAKEASDDSDFEDDIFDEDFEDEF